MSRLEAWKLHQSMAENSRFKDLPWQVLGPKFAGGRIEAVDVPRGDPKTIYVAVGSGGVWKTSNAGLTWKPIFTKESTFAIGDITVAPSDPNTIWVGTGECHLGGISFDGTGVFKSEDAGETWANMGLPDSKRISKVVVDPKDKNLVYVGVIGGRSGGESSGVYKTSDGGKTFTRVLSEGQSGIIDLVMDPNDRRRLFAASWSRRGSRVSGVFRSEDAGESWTRLKGGLLEEKVGRIALDVSPSRPGTVYALMVDHSRPGSRNRNPGSLLFRSDDNGDTWTRTHEGVVPTYVGWDFCDLRVAADNADEVYIGGLRMVRSRDGGKTFIDHGGFKHNTNDGNVFRLHSHQGVGLHLDVHEIWTDPENPDRVMLGNDGGLLVSWDRGDTWLHLNNLPIAEFYCIHLDDEKPFRIWGGTQDNASFVGPSTVRYEAGKEDQWEQVFLDPWSGGDGFETFPDPNDPSTFYFSQQNGDLKRGKLGDLQSGRRIRPRSESDARHEFAWWTPFFASRHTDETTLYCASQFVMRSEDRGDSWTKISPDLDGGALQKLSESPLDPKRLVAGGRRRVYFTSDGGETWEQRSTGLPGKNISDVITSHHDPECAYVAMTGSSGGKPASFVYATHDCGKTWKSIASNLPNETVYALAEDPGTKGLLFAGTELGVYVSLDSGANWESLCDTLPPAPVFDLKVHERDGALVAATHGLGIFLLEIKDIRQAASEIHSTASIDDLSTVAERTDWRGTATHTEVMQLVLRLADRSPLIHVEEAGKTFNKKVVPIMVIADPPVENPGQIGDRAVAFAWAGIHSGEVCGKPAVLMLARELATTKEHPLLKNLVVVLLPLLNADGNDLMSPDNRPGQLGPVLGMGTRANAMGLNINRDFTKLDTPAAQAVINVLNRWDPAIAMDLHTTNGSRHRYTLTYDGQRHPACDDGLRRLTRYELLPWVTKNLRANVGYETNVYGNFRGDRWVIDDALPRYSTHTVGMRHHISILSEAYSYATYKDRVLGTLEFVRHCFQYVSDNKEEVARIRRQAKQRTVELGNNPSADNLIALRRQPDFGKEPIEILGYENRRNRGEAGEPRTYSLFYNDRSKPTLSVTRPFGYVVPKRLKEVHRRLRLHGVTVSALEHDIDIDVEIYRVRELTRAEREYEGHRLVTVEVKPRIERRVIKAGTPIVRTGQPLGTLAAYLLEPQSEDGFCAWNFLDDEMSTGTDFPIFRLPTSF